MEPIQYCKILYRLLIWKIARFVKNKFNVDIVIKSVGLFSAKDIVLRVNQLQTIVSSKDMIKKLIYGITISCRRFINSTINVFKRKQQQLFF